MALPPNVVLQRGDRVPDFRLPDVGGAPTGPLLHSRGNPMVFAFSDAADDATLQPFVDAVGDLGGADLFLVTSQSAAANLTLARRFNLSFGVLSDTEGSVCRLFGFSGAGQPGGRLAVYALDRNLRILDVVRPNDGAYSLEPIVTAIKEAVPLPTPLPSPRPAPILLIPNVLDAKTCASFIATWHKKGNIASGTFDAQGNTDLGAGEQTSKARRDHEVADPKLKAVIGEMIGRRVAPEMQKAFDYQIVGTTMVKIARYGADTGGYFRPHRDNTTPDVQHRRFALSLVLNDPADYTGGGLRFAEYGPEVYYPPAGAALVFSGSLLHEVTPVTEGERFVLLTFLFGPREKEALQKGTS
jgi:predicted 2-oxoglutarate/Fe(II)-dependent dioxygenase YbiX/peroxiredoxin